MCDIVMLCWFGRTVSMYSPLGAAFRAAGLDMLLFVQDTTGLMYYISSQWSR